MFKRIAVSLSFLVLLAVGLSAVADEGTWTGEVLDLACYINNGAKGSDHAGCAKSCPAVGACRGVSVISVE